MIENQIGRSVRRLEDVRFLLGQGRYVDDIARSGELHAHVLRSPHAHAILSRIDVTEAAALAGVRGVFTAADLAAVTVAVFFVIVNVPAT